MSTLYGFVRPTRWCIIGTEKCKMRKHVHNTLSRHYRRCKPKKVYIGSGSGVEMTAREWCIRTGVNYVVIHHPQEALRKLSRGDHIFAYPSESSQDIRNVTLIAESHGILVTQFDLRTTA